MSIGSSLTGISFSGLTSGIDTDSIISRLIQIESLPLQRLAQQRESLNTRMSAMQQFKSKITGLSSAAGSLNMASAFASIAATSSNTDVATISADSTASAGIFSLTVSKLAQAHKISTAAQTDTTTALGKSGKIVINGKAVSVEASDSLQTIAGKINAASTGVTASLINGGTGKAYLTVTAKDTGAAKKIQIADLDGTVAKDLGLVSGNDAFRDPTQTGGLSRGFSSSSTPINTMLGTTSSGAKGFTLNEAWVEFDPSTDTLSSLAAKINQTGIQAKASVVTKTENGQTVQKLELTGVTGFVDDDGYLGALGITQKSFGNQLVAAQDASFTLDGVAMTSETNTVTSVIAGATLTLLKANETTPEKSTLSLTSDNSAVKKRITDFKEAFNSVIDFVKQTSAFDKDTFATGVLFGDASTQQVEASISNLVFNSVSGLSGNYTNLAALGFSFDSDGKLTLDESTLDTALASSPEAVGAVFRAKGTGSTTALTYVSSNDKTKASGTGGYAVNITQLATKASYLSSNTLAGTTEASETLTFSGTLIGSTSVQVTIPSGSSLTDAINAINSDSKLKDLLVASNEGGKLKIESKKYGSAADFTVATSLSGNETAGSIAFGAGAVKTAGVDIGGTINGKAATGAGQFLTSSTGDSEGLQLMYSGTATGDIGNMVFSKGIAAQMNSLVGSLTDATNGLLTANDKSLQSQIDSITDSITELQARIQQKQIDLKAKFSRMEQAIAQLQSQQSRLAAMR